MDYLPCVLFLKMFKKIMPFVPFGRDYLLYIYLARPYIYLLNPGL